MKLPFLIGIAVGLCLTSCERRELTYYNESEITLTADWSKADLDEESGYGATAIFYPQDGGYPKVVLMGDRTQATVRLGRGMYDVILFNRSFEDFGAIAFRGEDSFETLEVYARKVETRIETRVIVSSPEKLATAVTRGFEVTENMLGNYAPATSRANAATCPAGACRLHLEPEPLTQKAVAKLNIQGIHNVREARCTLDGIPLSIFLSDGHSGDMLGKQEFTVGNPVFNDGSFTDGTLTGEINVFGIDTGEPHNVELKALLVDGQTVVNQELTDVTVKEEAGEGNTYILYIEASGLDPMPDVKPEGGGDSGFDADVEGWGEEKVEEIPV